ncbi:NtaA/DmoA family FMN-dependent monooxygenase [Streptomyces sp. NPDC050560]|uniref:NtaA/DmoA family FMN-dependent monooxygenase n=1 Tax=Streptomyces sp. NPDC050560 TaxID=3365630 RepID=UPI00378EC7FB
MTGESPSMIVTAALMHGLGMHTGAWLARDGAADDHLSAALYKDIARTAERGGLHALFLAEQMTNQEVGTERPCGALDTATVLALMAGVTEHIGLVGTASTTYNEPYELARRFATLDHLSGGRVGWNSIATQNPTVVEQFGGGESLDHEQRYARADEFIDVVLRLWDSWEPDALVGDKDGGVFAREDGVHEIGHTGRYFSVRGPLPFPRTPQGRPVIFQAGSSPRGRDQAAKFADVVFTAQHLLKDAVDFRSDMRARAAAYGRDPDSIKILPGISLVLGATMEEARRRKERLDEVFGTGPNLRKLAKRVGLPVAALVLDEKFPAHLLGPDEEFKGSIGFRRSIVNLAVEKSLTVRELIAEYGGGHHQVVGTPEQVADDMQERMEAGAADGFTLMIDMLPSGIHDVVDLLVPELRRRGLFQDGYPHTTLRDSLGIGPARPAPTAAGAAAPAA